MAQSAGMISSPALDMDLAFKAREKLACIHRIDAGNLRQHVLLCNAYDRFQQRMLQQFRSPQPEPVETVLRPRPSISCVELADDSDDEDEEEEPEDSSLVTSVGQPPSVADDECPPPYEYHIASQLAEKGLDVLSLNQPQDNVIDEKDALLQGDDELDVVESQAEPPAYAVAVKDSEEAGKAQLTPQEQYIEDLLSSALPASPAPSKAKHARPGLLRRSASGYQT